MKISKIIVSLLLLAVVLTPVLALAAEESGTGIPTRPTGVDSVTNLDTLYNKIGNLLWQIVAIVALVLFVVAGIMFMTAQGDPTKVATARMFVLWGVVGIVVALLAYSIVKIVGAFFGTATP
jgi:uncharacterized membrane protein